MLTDYCIQYREAGSNLPFTEVYVGSNTTVFHLTGLKPLYSYEVRVAANTSAGRGPFSSVITSCRSSQHTCTFNRLTNNLYHCSLHPFSLLPSYMYKLSLHKTKIYRGMQRCAREAYMQYNLVTLCPTVKSGTFIRSTEDVHLN